jgi:Fe-S cluster assembly scaffold protein SufB
MHITCISVRDDIKINIVANGKVGDVIGGGEAAAKKDDVTCDVYHKIISQNKNVEMNINAKAVTDGDSKIIYRSSIGGLQNSTGAGSQNAKFIMLGDGVEIDAEPSLDLETNNIPTSHNVSIGGFENKNIFYMNLHGLDEKESKDMLVEAFLNY